MKEKKCLLCGNTFVPKSSRQSYCKKDVEKVCPICGETFVTECSPDARLVCTNPECKKRAGSVGATAKKKICKICGKEFTPKSARQEYCNEQVVRVCEVCGKEFTIQCTGESYKTKTCSSDCMQKLASINRQKSYQTQTRICELCGLEFNPRSNTQRVCEREHFKKCVVCGKEFKLNYKSSAGQVDLRQTCSDSCLSELHSRNNGFKNPETQKKAEATMLERYGVRKPAQSKVFQDKQKATMKQKYGVEFYAQHPDYIQKATETNLEKYGALWPIQAKNIQEKQKATTKEHYGVENPMFDEAIKEHMFDSYKERTGFSYPMQNPEVKEKSKQFFREHYGVDYYSQTEEYKEKYKATSLERYGTESPMQNDDIKAKARETSLKRYGATNFLASEQGKKFIKERMEALYGRPWHSQTAEWKEQMIIQCSNLPEWMEFTDHPVKYLQDHYTSKPKYRELSRDLGVLPSTVNDFIIRKGLRDYVEASVSYMEEELKEFIESLGVTVEVHNRKLIAPLEIDLYLPEYSIGIECNPTATHNSSFCFMNNEKISRIDYKYHQNKTNKCEEQGIFLFHIFGHEWEHRREIIQSMLRNLLSKNTNVIYARTCQIKAVSWEQSIQFLEANHRQGSASSPVRLGLFYEDELVSLMTFGEMRSGIGTGSDDLANCWELVRFCSKLNTTVVGGASKLFKYFVREHKPEQIRSFSDRAHTRGNLYASLGFTEIRRSEPGYVWVDVKTDRAYNRVNAQKQNLKKFLNDDTIDLAQTEAQIMEDHGFARVYDSGTITWEWHRD